MVLFLLGDAMGYSKLTYDDYYNALDYWQGDLGIVLPQWADEISAYGRSVSAIDFYEDIFGDDLEDHAEPYEYQKGEYGAIALEIEYKQTEEGQKSMAHRHTVTRGNAELYDLIDRSDNFCMIAPVSYAGKSRLNQNARFLYTICVEIDNIVPKTEIKELFYSFERENMRMPRPTYIVCSGNGLHLYFVFERPIPLFKNVFERLSEIKKYLTTWFWIKPISKSWNNIQYESICQAFRCVGTAGKDRKKIAMAFETGEKWTIEKLNELLPEDLQLSVIYKSNLTLEEAKERYPDWYKRRIEQKQSRGVWQRYPGIYHNWKQKMMSKDNGAVVGRRYNCLENLCSLAIQCGISPEEVEKDCREMAAYLETLTVDENNHFTEYDIISALSTYYRGGEGAYRRKREFIANKTGIKLPENKRNGRSQLEHAAVMRAIQSVVNPNWREGNGRKNKATQIKEWQDAHPEGTPKQCIEETGISKNTVYKWWNSEERTDDMANKKSNHLDYVINVDGKEILAETEDYKEARKAYNKRVREYYDKLKKEPSEEK